MFDIGWMELILIGIVALIVVGPKDLPKLFRTVGQFMGRARAMAREFQRSMEQAADESGLRDVSRGLDDLRDLNRMNPRKAASSYAKKTVFGEDAAAGSKGGRVGSAGAGSRPVADSGAERVARGSGEGAGLSAGASPGGAAPDAAAGSQDAGDAAAPDGAVSRRTG